MASSTVWQQKLLRVQKYVEDLVVEGSSKSPLTKDNVFAYCWTDNEYAKGSNEIASIIYHRLRNTDFAGIRTLRLIADGCPGQNKKLNHDSNYQEPNHLTTWLSDSAPDNVRRIEIVFPVVGHSFIPPDRVFAYVEKEVRKVECTIRPEDYLEIIGTHSTVIRLGSDCEVFNFKSSMGTVMKDVGSWHFQFKKCKRFFLQRSVQAGNVGIQGKVHYINTGGVLKKVTKKNKKFTAADLVASLINMFNKLCCIICALCFLILNTGHLSSANKILVVFPIGSRSHSSLGDSLVRTLLEAGHEVTYVSTFAMEANSSQFRFVDVSSIVEDTKEEKDTNLNPVKLMENRLPLHFPMKIGTTYAQQVVQHPAVQRLLQDPLETFDLVVAEWFYSGLLAPLAAVFDCPLVWYYSGDVFWQVLQMVHEPSSSAYTADIRSFNVPTVPFTVPERAYQLGLQLYMSGFNYYYKNHVEQPIYIETFSRPIRMRGRVLPEYDSLVYNGSLLLINSHPPLGQTMPLPQNVKYIWGHHIDMPIKALPKDLQRVLDKATKGAIYFSMGSNVRSKDLPKSVKQQLINGFELEQTVIWKFEEKLDYVPRNLHILEWAPQLSILCHPNMKMMITHGGMLSLIEATYCGVPLIAIPLFGDQFYNVDLTVARGCGIRIDLAKESPRKIFEAIHEISTNQSYRNNAKIASAIFRRRTTPVQLEMLHWLQLVMDTRGAAHLRSPAVKLSFSEKYHVDIFISVLLVVWFLSKVLKVLNVHLQNTDSETNIKQD
ncbi:LOW QUALITY PROTEIN: UDP-glycosyltransferase UGT48C1 [Aphomia sociella]